VKITLSGKMMGGRQRKGNATKNKMKKMKRRKMIILIIKK
jgi:hypothetical protein